MNSMSASVQNDEGSLTDSLEIPGKISKLQIPQEWWSWWWKYLFRPSGALMWQQWEWLCLCMPCIIIGASRMAVSRTDNIIFILLALLFTMAIINLWMSAFVAQAFDNYFRFLRGKTFRKLIWPRVNFIQAYKSLAVMTIKMSMICRIVYLAGFIQGVLDLEFVDHNFVDNTWFLQCQHTAVKGSPVVMAAHAFADFCFRQWQACRLQRFNNGQTRRSLF